MSTATPSSSSSASATPTASSPRRQWQWRWRFKVRLTHSYLILCSVLYLRLSILTMEALHCTSVQLETDGPLVSVLAMDMSTRCYEGGHLVTVILLVWPTLFLFCLGFPLLSAWLLYTSFHRAARKAVRESLRVAVSDGSPNELSTAPSDIQMLQLQKEQSVNQVWLRSSSGCTSPIAVSAPSHSTRQPQQSHGLDTCWPATAGRCTLSFEDPSSGSVSRLRQPPLNQQRSRLQAAV